MKTQNKPPMTSRVPDATMTPEQVAIHLHLSPRTVKNWLRSGRLPGVKVGKWWRVRAGDLAEYVEGLDRVEGDNRKP